MRQSGASEPPHPLPAAFYLAAHYSRRARQPCIRHFGVIYYSLHELVARAAEPTRPPVAATGISGQACCET
jgi:hypothetical protein